MNPAQTEPATTPPLELQWVASELLFDLDGTLIDSITAVEDAWRSLAAAMDVEVPISGSLHGRTAHDLLSSLLPAARVEAAVAHLSELERNPRFRVPALPGALDLIDSVPAHRWAIVTSSARAVALVRLRAGGLPVPPLLVTGDDVTHGKPHPEPYLSARRRAGDRAPAIAFEDTVAGLRSARAAGCRTVGLIGTASAAELAQLADAVITSLSDVAVQRWDGGVMVLRLRVLADPDDARHRRQTTDNANV